MMIEIEIKNKIYSYYNEYYFELEIISIIFAFEVEK